MLKREIVQRTSGLAGPTPSPIETVLAETVAFN
jgi:hypothetical protein